MKSSKKVVFIVALAFAGCKVYHKTGTANSPKTETETAKTNPQPTKTVGFAMPELLKPGYASMQDYIQKNVQYPDAAKEHKIEGTVMVSFTVDTTGVIKDAKADNDIGYGCGAAAVDAVQSMSPMQPASNNGKWIRFHVKTPVNFQLVKKFTSDSEAKLEKVYSNMPGKEAQYPGGTAARDKFIQANLNVPSDMETKGTIFVSADIEADGSVTDVKVLKAGIPSLDAEAVRVVKLMPKWIPARNYDTPVKSSVIIPVEIKK